MERNRVEGVVDIVSDALDTDTQPWHKVHAIPQEPRKSAVTVDSYSGFESSLTDHFIAKMTVFRLLA